MKPAGWILLGTLAFVAFAVWSESVAANTMKPIVAPVSPSRGMPVMRTTAQTTAQTITQTAAQTAAQTTIAIVSGTWGANCGAPRGNVTRDLARHCNGLRTCGYVLDARAMGAPSSRVQGMPPSIRNEASSRACRVDYRAQWRCGGHEFHDAALSAGASPGDTLVLSCVHETGPGH